MRSGKVKILGGLVVAILLTAAVAVSSGSSDVCKAPENTRYHHDSPAPVKIQNSLDYNGRLLVYIVEPTSRWQDYQGNDYHYSFIGFALDTTFTLADGESLGRTVTWDANPVGYGDIQQDNIMAIAALYDMSQSYPASSDTGTGTAAPFDAYYVDAAAAAKPDSQWNNIVSEDFSHTVFAEEGTATWCSPCASMNASMSFVDHYFDYPFFYVAMVADVDDTAAARMDSHFNLAWFPSTYFDGGYHATIGSESYSSIIAHILDAGSRVVNTFGLKVDLNWLGGGNLEVQVDLSENTKPQDPPAPSGSDGIANMPCEFSVGCTDPDDDQIYYRFHWQDGDTSGWYGPFNSGETCNESHNYTAGGSFEVKVQARDSWSFETGWSAALAVIIYEFLAGDANGSGNVNILDVTFLINYLYKGGSAPDPIDSGDPNGSHTTNILDVTYIINYLYKGGPEPVYPSK